MAEYTNTPGMSLHNAALMHTLQRHRDILQVHNVQLLHFLVLLSHTEKCFNSMLVILSTKKETFVKLKYVLALFWFLFDPTGLYS